MRCHKILKWKIKLSRQRLLHLFEKTYLSNTTILREPAKMYSKHVQLDNANPWMIAKWKSMTTFLNHFGRNTSIEVPKRLFLCYFKSFEKVAKKSLKKLLTSTVSDGTMEFILFYYRLSKFLAYNFIGKFFCINSEFLVSLLINVSIFRNFIIFKNSEAKCARNGSNWRN
jgi:hypothetical protein